MLHTENEISIRAPLDLIYQLAADVTRWPQILDHYRYVHVLGGEHASRRRRVKMAASRSGIPVSWTSIQYLDPENRQIQYHHVAGVTRGMDVIWQLDPGPEETRVRIWHDLAAFRWWLRLPLAHFIVGRVFVENIADKTLHGIKRRAEAMVGREE